MIRVIVVDDSLFLRNSLVSLIQQDPEIKVVATARDGLDALKKIQAAPEDFDVVTLDVEMPHLNGIETLKRLMATVPLPVLMISSLTEEGAETTLKALELGALDFIPKSLEKDKEAFGKEIRQKIKSLSRRKVFVRLKYGLRNKKNEKAAATPLSSAAGHGKGGKNAQIADYPTTPCKGPRDLVVIGVSTGGPPVVQKILSALPENLQACILVAQHMPPAFTGPFARRLDVVCKIHVSEAVDGDRFERGHAYICPGGKHIGIRMRGALPEIAVTTEPKEALYKPTVNVLMGTAGKFMGRRTLGIMLTGMGSDGIEGARILKENGGCLIAQDEASCVVYGMNKAVIDAKLANVILDADEIAQAVISIVHG
ncbi:MAG: chemotaxis response regulator protein-glutamate methylesterase [Desulfovibrionaceae bacterium]|nr:chemotaxis response regulator protein-glutamate methylesterase [Desulfovibrionaceae bacterium]